MLLSTLLLIGAKYAADAMRRSTPTVPTCDACPTPLPGEYSYTLCCHTKLCPACERAWTAASRGQCCVCGSALRRG